MASIFNYHSFDVSVHTETKSLAVKFKKERIDPEFIFEIESLFAWLSSHIEINAVVFSSQYESLLEGIDIEKFRHLTSKKFAGYLKKLQKIVYSMYMLPQTLIADMGMGTKNIGCEFVVGIDIKIAKENASMHFDHLNYGLTPSSAGSDFLSLAIGNQRAKNWILSGATISIDKLVSSGFINESYKSNSTEIIQSLLERINKQSPVARIQAKRSLLDPILAGPGNRMNKEMEIAMASLLTEDWKKESDDFTLARDYSTFVKEAAKSKNE